MLTEIWQNTRYAARALAAAPSFTAAALLCLALGIGLTTAIFSVANGILLKPLPYDAPERLVRLYSEFPGLSKGGLRRFWISAPEFKEMQRDLKNWKAMEAWSIGGSNLAGAGAAEPFRVASCGVSGGLFQLLGAKAQWGRIVEPKDDLESAPLVVVISHGLFQRAFAGDRSVIGREARYNGQAATIVGVMPPGFTFPPGDPAPPEVWVPFRFNQQALQRRGGHFLYVLGRLGDGVSFERAQSELTRYLETTAAQHTEGHHDFHPKLHPLIMHPLHEETIGGVKRAILMLLGAVGFVLLIACVNVANLLLARSEARQKEIAVRMALGAGRGRLLSQFVTEGLLLSALGATLGLLLAQGALAVLRSAAGDNIPRADEVGLDPMVLGFALLLTIGTGCFFGLAPILHGRGSRLAETLKAAAGRNTAGAASHHFRRALVSVELALALVLLIGTGLMVRGFWKLLEVRPGFDPANITTASVNLPGSDYRDGQAALQFFNRLEERLRSELPGAGIAFATGLAPLRPLNANDTMIEGLVPKPGGPTNNIDYWNFVSPSYFSTMGVRLIEGRVFDERDGPQSMPAIVINQTLAKIYYEGQSPLGRRIKPGGGGNATPWFTVIGVVEDVKNAGLDRPAGTELYLLPAQVASLPIAARGMNILVKTSGSSPLPQMRRAVAAVDPNIPLFRPRSMDEIIHSLQSRPRFLTLLLSLFTFTALALAATGIYGVISYAVAQRTNEFGIRMALGAQSGDILKQVLGNGMILAVIGLGVGLAGALAVTRFLEELLFGVSPLDPATYVAMGALLLAVTLIACWIPATRATRVDPIVALRYE